MKTETKFEKRKQELFTQISDLIQRDGLSNLTVRYICQELKISTGTFYHYFPEKGDITRILFSGIDHYFETEVLSELGDDEATNLIIFAKGYATFIEMNGVEASRNISVAPFKNKEKQYLAEGRSIFKVLYEIVERGESKGQLKFDKSPLEVARMIMILLRGYCSDWAKCDGDYDIVEELTSFMTLFVKALV